jgi:hypothetical protein
MVTKPGKIASSTRSKYEHNIRNHIRPTWQNIALADMRTLKIQQWLDAKEADGISWATRTDLRNLLSGIFTKSTEWGLWKFRTRWSMFMLAGRSAPASR